MVCPELQDQEQKLALSKGQALPPAQPAAPGGSGAGRREGQAGAEGCFALFPVTVPQQGSRTRVGLHIPQAGPRWAADSHSCAKPAGPRALFSAREAPLGAAGGGSGLGRLISGTSALLGVLRRPEDLLVALREDLRIQTLVSAPGCRPAPYGHALWGESELLASPWEQPTLSPSCFACSVTAEDLSLSVWPRGLVMPQPGARTAGGSWRGCRVTSALGR